jgi:hypothetical protein
LEGRKTRKKLILMIVIRIFGWIVLVAFLTIISQVGGIILLCCLPFFKILNKKFPQRRFRHLTNTGVFSGIYLLVSVLLIPPLAAHYDRSPLPVTGNKNLKPLNYFTCILNRHYVDPALIKTLEEVAGQMNKKYPETVVAYLDGNFPVF